VLHTIDGETIDLGRLYGKQADYLKLWATWRGPCMQQMPHFEHAYETAGPGEPFRWLWRLVRRRADYSRENRFGWPAI
jgi:thiol-disulfide isomerase/thioredoxin